MNAGSQPISALQTSLSFALKATARCSDATATIQLHALVLRLGVAADVRLMTTLLDSYAKCGDLPSARKVFDEMPVRDVTTWNALVAGLRKGRSRTSRWRCSAGWQGATGNCCQGRSPMR